MSKVKVKKHNTFIDMTAMSDVTVLLLTFFMLTATFMPKEPIRVITPASVVEIKIPDNNVLTVLIKPTGQCYLNLDRPEVKKEVLELIGKDNNIKFTDQQIASFINQPSIGVPINKLPEFLSWDLAKQDEYLKLPESGIPADSTNNQLKTWVKYSVNANATFYEQAKFFALKEEQKRLNIALKADRGTPYVNVKTVIGTLQDLRQNRFSLVTTLRGMPQGF